MSNSSVAVRSADGSHSGLCSIAVRNSRLCSLRPARPAASQSCFDRTVACVYMDHLALTTLARASCPALLRHNATAMKDSTQQSFRRQHRFPNSPLHFHREKCSRRYHADRGTQHQKRWRKHWRRTGSRQPRGMVSWSRFPSPPLASHNLRIAAESDEILQPKSMSR